MDWASKVAENLGYTIPVNPYDPGNFTSTTWVVPSNQAPSFNYPQNSANVVLSSNWGSMTQPSLGTYGFTPQQMTGQIGGMISGPTNPYNNRQFSTVYEQPKTALDTLKSAWDSVFRDFGAKGSVFNPSPVKAETPPAAAKVPDITPLAPTYPYTRQSLKETAAKSLDALAGMSAFVTGKGSELGAPEGSKAYNQQVLAQDLSEYSDDAIVYMMNQTDDKTLMQVDQQALADKRNINPDSGKPQTLVSQERVDAATDVRTMAYFHDTHGMVNRPLAQYGDNLTRNTGVQVGFSYAPQNEITITADDILGYVKTDEGEYMSKGAFELSQQGYSKQAANAVMNNIVKPAWEARYTEGEMAYAKDSGDLMGRQPLSVVIPGVSAFMSFASFAKSIGNLEAINNAFQGKGGSIIMNGQKIESGQIIKEFENKASTDSQLQLQVDSQGNYTGNFAWQVSPLQLKIPSSSTATDLPKGYRGQGYDAMYNLAMTLFSNPDIPDEVRNTFYNYKGNAWLESKYNVLKPTNLTFEEWLKSLTVQDWNSYYNEYNAANKKTTSGRVYKPRLREVNY